LKFKIKLFPFFSQFRIAKSSLFFLLSTYSVMACSANQGNPETAQSVYEFSVNDIKGEAVSLEKYRGHVLIIVNVASKCGYTAKHYAELNEIYDQYAESKGKFHLQKCFLLIYWNDSNLLRYFTTFNFENFLTLNFYLHTMQFVENFDRNSTHSFIILHIFVCHKILQHELMYSKLN